MIDRTTLLTLAAAAGLMGTAAARAFAATGPAVHDRPALLVAAPDDEDDKKPAMKKGDEKKGDEKKGDEKEDGEDKGEKKEKKIEQDVPMNMVPQAVIDAVMKECPGGKITEAELEVKKHTIMYGFDVKVGDVAYDVNVTVDGKFYSKKVDKGESDEKDEKDAKPAAGEKK